MDVLSVTKIVWSATMAEHEKAPAKEVGGVSMAWLTSVLGAIVIAFVAFFVLSAAG